MVRSSSIAKKISELALSKKADNVVILDLRKISPVADFFVVCSADSDVQVKAIAAAVDGGMKEAGTPPWHKEMSSTNWVVLDFVDVVLHIFHKNTRPFYNLEKLWGDAKITSVAERRPVKKRAKRVARRTVKTKVASKARRKAASS